MKTNTRVFKSKACEVGKRLQYFYLIGICNFSMLKKSYTEHVIKDQLARVIYNRLGTIRNAIGTNKLCADASRPVLALLQG